MFTKKVIRLKTEQMNELNEIEKQVNANGGEITTTKLIRDAVDVFLEYFKSEAIKKYSGSYELKKED